MTDLKNWTPRLAPQPVALEGRYVSIEPYDRTKHLEDLWAALGREHTNERLKFFAAPDFANVVAFGNWLDTVQTKGGWLTEVFRNKKTGNSQSRPSNGKQR